MLHTKIETAASRTRQITKATIDPSSFERLTDFLAAVFGTRRWVVAPRLTVRMRERGLELAVRQERYRAVERAWKDAHGWAMGYPPEMQPDWLRAAIACYRESESAICLPAAPGATKRSYEEKRRSAVLFARDLQKRLGAEYRLVDRLQERRRLLELEVSRLKLKLRLAVGTEK